MISRKFAQKIFWKAILLQNNRELPRKKVSRSLHKRVRKWNKLLPQLNFWLHIIKNNVQGKFSKLNGKFCKNNNINFQLTFFENKFLQKVRTEISKNFCILDGKFTDFLREASKAFLKLLCCSNSAAHVKLYMHYLRFFLKVHAPSKIS